MKNIFFILSFVMATTVTWASEELLFKCELSESENVLIFSVYKNQDGKYLARSEEIIGDETVVEEYGVYMGNRKESQFSTPFIEYMAKLAQISPNSINDIRLARIVDTKFLMLQLRDASGEVGVVMSWDQSFLACKK